MTNESSRFRCKFSIDKSGVPPRLQEHGVLTKIIRGMLPSLVEAVNSNPECKDPELFGRSLVVISTADYKAVKSLLLTTTEAAATARSAARAVKQEGQILLIALKKENGLADVQDSILRLTTLCLN